MSQISFWQGDVQYRLVRVFGGGDGERLTCVQVREAATSDRVGHWVEAPAAIAEEALSRAHRVARAREHAEQLMARFRQVHAIAGERNPCDEAVLLRQMEGVLRDLVHVIDGPPETDLLGEPRSP
jgi:hypothetical protein